MARGILVDTSAWIELLRASGHPAHLTLRHHLERRSPIATAEPVIMELLAGTRSRREHGRLRARLLALPQLALGGLADSFRPIAAPDRHHSAGAGARTSGAKATARPGLRPPVWSPPIATAGA